MIEKLKQLSSKVSIFNILIITYVVVNLLQAIFTPIHDDEAYYWIYSQSMDWGYFDHPPAVALIVKIGTLLFGSTVLGVRFVTVLLSGLTIFFSWKLTSEHVKNKENSFLIFVAILVSIPGLNMYGFITTPDVPLLFSFVIYLIAFKKLIDKQSVLNAMFWAVTAAMLIYSKYHGGLIILISVIVQPKLLKQWTTYFAGFVALLLITPHLYWQYNHDFISFEYHLFQRTSGVFTIDNPLGYIGGTVGILNPALFALILIIAFKFKNLISDEVKVFYRLFWGVIIFFFFYSFRSRIEAHWVVAALIPMTLVLHDVIVRNSKFMKAIKWITITSIFLLIIARLVFVFSDDFQKLALGYGEEYYKSVERIVPKDRKIVFMNSFQKTSKYRFYTGRDSWAYNNVYYRKNQYDLGEYDTVFNNSKVLLISWWNSKYFEPVQLDNGMKYKMALMDNYTVFTKVKGEIEDLPSNLVHGKQTVDVTLENPYDYDITFDDGKFPISIMLMFENKEEKKYFSNLKYTLKTLKAKSTYSEKMTFSVSDKIPEGEYNCQIVFDYIYPQYVSRKTKIKIEK
jgi:hypothetical protein